MMYGKWWKIPNENALPSNLMIEYSGLYYQHMMIINYDSSVVIKWSFKLFDATRGVIYDRHMFIVQATDQPPATGLPSLRVPSSAACPLGKMDLTKMPMLPRGESLPPTTLNPRPFLPTPFSKTTFCRTDLKTFFLCSSLTGWKNKLECFNNRRLTTCRQI